MQGVESTFAGQDAGSLLAQQYPGGMPLDLVSAIVTAVASALDSAHEKGLVHRGVTPANILLANVANTTQRRIALTDFGVAHTAGPPGYAAPEQLTGGNADARADQYSLAATAYHLLTGTPPNTDSVPAPEPPAVAKIRPDLAALDRVLVVALANNPNYRFASCVDFANALAAQVSTMPASVNQIISPIPDAAASAPPPRPDLPPSPGPAPQYWSSPGPGAPPKPGSRHAPVLWAAGIAIVAIIVGTVVFLLTQDKGSSGSSTSSSAVASEPTLSRAQLPPSTRSAPARTAAPPTVFTPSSQSFTPAPPPPITSTAVLVGTCDEGGSCGVKQRTGPYRDAPKLVPDPLLDATTVTLVCQTSGDTMTNTGYGTSSVWYRLANGAYVNGVYLQGQDPGISLC
ncbi:MAG: serine/threonine protein kinase, bacterial [Mycobacterium sp.]|jgi:serine/threonine-protein kinase|nr:serine/threonine protein kinase, bacterial [Mycobacterium sp.]